MVKPFSGILPVTIESTTLRKFEMSDVPAFHFYRSDPDLARLQGWEMVTNDEAENFVEKMSSVTSLIKGGWVQLALGSSPSNVIIGDIGIFLEAEATEAEIGFTVSSSHQRLGHASRGIEAALRVIWLSTPAGSVRATTDARNVASIKALESSGFDRVEEYNTVFKGEECTEFKYLKAREIK